ncbi:MAG: 16S rRNA (guanine966-N2)-methyltransferase [bacterium]
MLKVLSGSLKGRTIQGGIGWTVRPTLGKSRSAMFNVIESRYDLKEFDVIDLFAGTGALGFEAISRGARRTTFIENEKIAIPFLLDNIGTFNIRNLCSVQKTDTLRWIDSQQWIEGELKLFLLDPPYDSDLAQQVISKLEQVPELKGSIVVVEVPKRHSITYSDDVILFQQKVYGKTRIDFLEL